MYKYLFFNDYSEGAHPEILKALEETNLHQEAGYGEDSYTNNAKKIIRTVIRNDQADIHFVSGGTQANLIVIEFLLKPFESVISPSFGHINTHEAGAVEATGHKIEAVETKDGKITLEGIRKKVEVFENEHTAKPKAVFISQATEYGTIYSKKELTEISRFCKEKQLILYLDGARLGSAVTCKDSDLTIADIAKLVDVFYIGGTKNGALFGEAIVFTNNKLGTDFRFYLKRRGALLSKGRGIGVQFLTLFKNSLYFDLARHANNMAEKLRQGIKKSGYEFLTPSPSNQIFPIFPNKLIKKIEELYGFYVWEKVNDKKSAIRLVTSWATEEDAVGEFLRDLKNLS